MATKKIEASNQQTHPGNELSPPMERFTTVDNENGMKCAARRKKSSIAEAASHGITTDHPTSYIETMMHLFKGNIGTGMFALGDAFKNAGIIAAPILTLAIAIVSVHCQHVLIKCAKRMQEVTKSETLPDFAETVEMCFANGPPKLRGWASRMKSIVNIFICVTQLGFCCIYFVFIGTNIKQILDYYDIFLDVHIVMALAFVPMLLPSLLTNLKFLAPVSMIANICIAVGVTITMYYAFKDGLPSPAEREYFTPWNQLALYFGTAIFAFEGIALVLPLKNAMRKPSQFDRPWGVLNVGMCFVSALFIFTGFIGYLKWGQGVCGSLTLNLDVDDWLARMVKVTVSVGVLLGYPLQFFVAIQILWPSVSELIGIRKRPLLMQLLFRTLLVLVTFTIAELVPKLNLFISLIGALCSTALALVFPPVIEMIVSWEKSSSGSSVWMFLKNICILIVGLIGFSTGSYESISSIVQEFVEDFHNSTDCAS